MSELTIPETPDFFKSFTDARIALKRAGHTLATEELLKFKLAHASAMDAVYSTFDYQDLSEKLHDLNYESVLLDSMAKDRYEYLQRPDLGRVLSEASLLQLQRQEALLSADICIVAADGLSASAISLHLLPFLHIFLPMMAERGHVVSPVLFIKNGRVAIGDQVGAFWKAKIVIVLIGERPGLSSPDSMGIYFTYHPKQGLTDESRNCISNVRTRGLPYLYAAEKLTYLITESLRLGISGVNLKDDYLKLS